MLFGIDLAATDLRKFIQKSIGEIIVVILDGYSSTYNFTIDATANLSIGQP
jgi:hypothetical protein